jgi:hypothetical protein
MQDFSEPFAFEEHFEYPFNDQIDAYWVTLFLMIASKFLALEFHAPYRFAVRFFICEGRV